MWKDSQAQKQSK